MHGTPPETVIQPTGQGLDAISAGPDLATERTTPASAKRLQAAIGPLKGRYDLIATELTFNALQACNGLLIPLESDNSSLQGLYQITEIARHFQQTNPALQIMGTVITRYDPRSKINRYMRDAIAETGRELNAPLLTAIRAGIAIREAQALRQSLFKYAPKSKPAQDYMNLYHQIQED